MDYDKNTKIAAIAKMPQFAKVGKYFIAGRGIMPKLMAQMTVEKLTGGTWDAGAILYGLHRLEEITRQEPYLYPVYGREDIKAEKAKEDVNVIHFPAKTDRGKKPYVVLCAGGAYSMVSSVAETYPVAARLNELGYDAFVMTYRTGEKEVLQKALADVARVLRYIMENAAALGISEPERYVLSGYSAGGNLSCLWGTHQNGYGKFGLPKPAAMILLYPLISLNHVYHNSTEKMITKKMCGTRDVEAKKAAIDVEKLIDKEYPPCYVACCLDDKMVPPENSKILKEKLEAFHIPVMYEDGAHGGHAFGLGTGTDIEGWCDRAVKFIEGLKR